jgi:hypothetical protein
MAGWLVRVANNAACGTASSSDRRRAGRLTDSPATICKRITEEHRPPTRPPVDHEGAGGGGKGGVLLAAWFAAGCLAPASSS